MILLAASPADASHYLLADVPDMIPAQHHEALRAEGVTNTAQLYERVVRRNGRRSLATRTRIPIRDLSQWARLLDLMQLEGIGPKMVRLIYAAGVTTLRELQKADAGPLWGAMRAANGGGRYSEIVPAVEVVQGWIEIARKVEPRLE